MNENNPENCRRVIKKATVRPAVEVDCSNWVSGVPGRVIGRLSKTASVRPAVEVDCSGWESTAPGTLEITLAMDTAVDAIDLALGLLDLLGAVSVFEQKLGGAGLSKFDARKSNGLVILSLVPDEPTGAASRMRQVCDALNRVTVPPELSLPSVVKTITARVA